MQQQQWQNIFYVTDFIIMFCINDYSMSGVNIKVLQIGVQTCFKRPPIEQTNYGLSWQSVVLKVKS